MQIPTNRLGLLLAEIDSAGSLRLSGDRVLFGAKRNQSETEWLVRQKVAQCRQGIADIVHSFGGVVVQTRGDQVLCNLTDADSAMLAGCAIQRAQRAGTDASPDPTSITTQLGVRVALHYDKIMVESGRLSGRSLILLDALLEAIESDQVVATEDLVTNLRPALRTLARAMAPLKLLDDEGPVSVMELNWKSAPAAVEDDESEAGRAPSASDTADRLMPPGGFVGRAADYEESEVTTAEDDDDVGSTTAQFDRRDLLEQLQIGAKQAEEVVAATRLELVYKDKRIVLDATHPTITLRSGPERVQHARISLQDDGFVLENLHDAGTHVHIQGGDGELCRSSLFLEGQGAISLGSEPASGGQAIQFQVHG